MTEKSSENKHTALQKTAKRLNIVWLIPFLALIITAGLLWNNSINKGPAIELYIYNAEGIEAGKTLVKLRSVTIGHVTGVRLDADYKKAVVSIQMEADTEDLLREDTQFWLVKPRVENTGISGLNTLLSGSYFETLLGTSEEHASTFTALDEPPAVTSAQPGLMVKLNSDARRRLGVGDFVNYRGFTAGRVVSSRLDFANNEAEYEIFIAEPYTNLLNANTKFWISSGIDISLTTEGLRMNTESIDNILRGGVEFDNLNDDYTKEAFDDTIEHHLFTNFDEARLDALRSGMLYVVMLDKNLKSISKGSAVFYKSVKIGEVIEAPWYQDIKSLFADGQYIPVLVSLNFKDDDRAFIHDLFQSRLDAGTLCASTSAANIITGDNRINLTLAKDQGQQCTTELKSYRGLAVIPAVSSQTMQDKLDLIVANLQSLDLKGISDDLRNMLNSTAEAMQAFAASNDKVERTKLLEKMVTSFESFTKATQSYAKDSEIYDQLQKSLISIEKMLRELDPAMTELGQAPNSIIFGSSSQDPKPTRYQGGSDQ